MATKFIAYCRVSTQKQGDSGLGLAAQEKAVADFVAARSGELIQPVYVEVESGRKSERPELQKAIRACKKHGAVLLVAKLDRLSRNVAFISTLLESGIEINAADMPEANRTMFQMMAVFAEWEADRISKRTREALAVAKANGKKLGNPRPSGDTEAARMMNRAKAAERRHTPYARLIRELHEDGLSLRAIAVELEERGYESPRGKVTWTAGMVRNLLPKSA